MTQYTGYLFVHFIGEQPMGEQIYFSLSRDGMHWNDLNGGKPVLVSEIGEKGVRDPFILRNPLNGKYVIIATDLRIEAGKGWDTAQHAGSRNLIVWQSDNMTDWEGPESHEVGIPEAGCVWAPEAIFDEERQEFLVFWASMVKEEGDEAPKQRIYASHTKDFHSFTPAEKFQEGKNHIIDTTILRVGDYYYRFAKDETVKNIRLDRSRSLDKDSFEPVDAPVLDALLGVEGRTGICIPSHMIERDGMHVALLLCELMAKTGKTLAQLVDEVEREYGAMAYAVRDLRVENEVSEIFRTMLPGLNPHTVAGREPVAVSHMDGLRLEFDDESWVLLRPSRMDPVVRVYAEAPTVQERDRLLEAGCEIARGEALDSGMQ